MYCNHCAKRIKTNQKVKENEMYVCPRCGHLISTNLNKQEIKELSAAAHSEIHKASNNLNTAKTLMVIGFVMLCISFMFLLMSYKATAGGELVTNCLEFIVFILFLVLGSSSFISGICTYIYGHKRKVHYQTLLKNIYNKVFYQ